jgi:hypothetical protein
MPRLTRRTKEIATNLCNFGHCQFFPNARLLIFMAANPEFISHPPLEIVRPPEESGVVVDFQQYKKAKAQEHTEAKPKGLIYGIGTEEEMQVVSGFGAQKDREAVEKIVADAWEVVFADDQARDHRFAQENLAATHESMT